jgi:hypothetical protein
MKQLFMYLSTAFAYRLVFVDKITAITTIRLWHELHVEKKIAHDFEHLLRPPQDDVFVGVSRFDELRAVGICQQTTNLSSLRLSQVAHAPNQMDAVCFLLQELTSTPQHAVNWKKIKTQQRWYYEALYLT